MFIDAHTHLDHYNENQLKKALQQIQEKNILTISNSMDISSYQKNINIGKESEFIIPTFGIHPWNAHDYVDKLNEIEEYIYKSKMIGEIGLDFYWVEDKSKYEAQVKVLKFFLEKAKQQNKIVNLHTKGAEEEILNLLDEYKIQRAINHWYSGPLSTLRKMIERDYYFTIGVEAAYSQIINDILREIPLNRILTETDNPGGEEWLSGELGMPILIEKVAAIISKLKGISEEQVIKIVEDNYRVLV